MIAETLNGNSPTRGSAAAEADPDASRWSGFTSTASRMMHQHMPTVVNGEGGLLKDPRNGRLSRSETELIPHCFETSYHMLAMQTQARGKAAPRNSAQRQAPFGALRRADTDPLRPGASDTAAPTGSAPRKQGSMVHVSRSTVGSNASQGKLIDMAYNAEERNHLANDLQGTQQQPSPSQPRHRVNNPQRTRNMENSLRSLEAQVGALSKAQEQLQGNVAGLGTSVASLSADVAALPSLIAAQLAAQMRGEVPPAATADLIIEAAEIEPAPSVLTPKMPARVQPKAQVVTAERLAGLARSRAGEAGCCSASDTSAERGELDA